MQRDRLFICLWEIPTESKKLKRAGVADGAKKVWVAPVGL